MSSFGSFQSSVLGMIGQSHALGVIGANIANAATDGYSSPLTKSAGSDSLHP